MEYDDELDFRLIGRRVCDFRKMRSLKQEKLTEAAKRSVPYAIHIERGKKKVSTSTFIKLAAAAKQIYGMQHKKSTVLPVCPLRQKKIDPPHRFPYSNPSATPAIRVISLKTVRIRWNKATQVKSKSLQALCGRSFRK